MQDQFTQKIVAALAVKLTPEKERHIANRGTENVEAYDAYLQGLGHYFPQTSENLGKALPYLKKAVELDPKVRFRARNMVDFDSLDGNEQYEAIIYAA